MAATINASTSPAGIVQTADGTGILALQTGNTTAVTIDASQNVGIGTTSPSYALDVQSATTTGVGTVIGSYNTASSGSSISTLRIRSAGTGASYWDINTGNTASGLNGSIRFFDNIASAERMRIDSSGNLLVGTTNASVSAGAGLKYIINGSDSYLAAVMASTSGSNNYHLYSTGASAFRFFVSTAGVINATSTSISALSDISLKENIRDLETGLTEVMALRPRRFDWKEEIKIPEKNIAGFIAQEVEQVLPELIYDYQYDTDTIKKAIKMGDILPTLVKAIQEQQALITSLTARITALEGA